MQEESAFKILSFFTKEMNLASLFDKVYVNLFNKLIGIEGDIYINLLYIVFFTLSRNVTNIHVIICKNDSFLF